MHQMLVSIGIQPNIVSINVYLNDTRMATRGFIGVLSASGFRRHIIQLLVRFIRKLRQSSSFVFSPSFLSSLLVALPPAVPSLSSATPALSKPISSYFLILYVRCLPPEVFSAVATPAFSRIAFETHASTDSAGHKKSKQLFARSIQTLATASSDQALT